MCKTTLGLHLHHIYFGTGNRRISDANGFTVYLCGRHHNLSLEGVHFDGDLDLELKVKCQRKFEETHSREEFMALIGKNYIDDEDYIDESRDTSAADGCEEEGWLSGTVF